MTVREKLLPCPFCGGETHLTNSGPGRHFVHCTDCSSLFEHGTPEEAVNAWNRRASQAEIERLTTLEAELWRLSLVIESAVRNADWPNYADVLALIKTIKRPDTALGAQP